MATNPRIQAAQAQIKQQGLSRDQAMSKYGLTQEDTDWMGKNLGLRFAPPAPGGLMTAAAPGAPTPRPGTRGGDPSLMYSAMAKPPAPAATPTASNPAPSYMTTSPTSRSAPAAATTAATTAPRTAAPAPAATTSQSYTAPTIATPQAATARPSTYNAATARAQTAQATTANVVNQNTANWYNAARGQAATYTPGEQSTVQGQIADIVDSGSPLMERAETRGLQQANRRGLMNSSMAVQAGQTALYDAALPIAQQDAATFATSQRDNTENRQEMNVVNTDATNAARQSNTDARNDRNALNAQLGTQVNLANAGARTETSQFNAASANDVSRFNASERNDQRQINTTLRADISKFNASESNDLRALGMDSNTRLTLGTIEANYKVLMQTQAGAGDLYKQYMGSIAQVLQNKDMDATAKNNAINTLVSGLNGSLDVMGDLANMNIPELTFDEAPADGGSGDGDSGGAGTDSGATTSGNFPTAIDGAPVNWSAPTQSGQTLRQEYLLYSSTAPNPLTAAEWYRRRRTLGGAGMTPGGGAGDEGDGTASPF
jgi:hypothetical protein